MSKLEELIQQYCPDGVEYKHLGEICNIKGRIGFRGYTRDDQVKEGEGALSLSPSNIQDGQMDYTKGTYITWAKYDESPEIMTFNGDIIFCKTASVGKVALVKDLPYKATINPQLVVLKDIQCNAGFLTYVLGSDTVQKKVISIAGIGSVPNVSQKALSELEIPIPPLPVQEEIVRVLDTFTELQAELQAELQKRLQQYNYYRDNIFQFEGRTDVEWKKLGDIGKVCMCKRIMKDQTSSSGDVPFYKIGTFGGDADAFISKELFEEYKNKYSYPNKGDILISAAGTIGRTVVFDGKASYFQDSNIVWLKHNESVVLNSFLRYCYTQSPWAISTGGTIARLYNDNILNAVIPVPSISEQQRIVDILDRFDALTTDLSQGLPAEIEKRKLQYEYYRDRLLTFKRKEA